MRRFREPIRWVSWTLVVLNHALLLRLIWIKGTHNLYALFLTVFNTLVLAANLNSRALEGRNQDLPRTTGGFGGYQGKDRGTMRTIWKYQLVPGLNKLNIHTNSTPVSVGAQGERICLWVHHEDTDNPKEERSFYVCGTGHSAPSFPNYVHLGTCQAASGLVWHVYEHLGDEDPDESETDAQAS